MLIGQQGVDFDSDNWRQNELRHFVQNWANSSVLLTSKGGNTAFPPPSLPCNVVLMFKLPIENNKHLNFEWWSQGRGADSFVLRSYPIVSTILSQIVGLEPKNDMSQM